MYTFACSRRLLDDEVKELSSELRCKVRYIGKVAWEERWDYKTKKRKLTKRDERAIVDRGLEVLGEY